MVFMGKEGEGAKIAQEGWPNLRSTDITKRAEDTETMNGHQLKDSPTYSCI